jgi:hypothetical protein
MQALKQRGSQPEASRGKVTLRWDVLFKDLSLLISLMVAHMIVWRTLRRRRHDRAARRNRFKLIRGSHYQADQRAVPY